MCASTQYKCFSANVGKIKKLQSLSLRSTKIFLIGMFFLQIKKTSKLKPELIEKTESWLARSSHHTCKIKWFLIIVCNVVYLVSLLLDNTRLFRPWSLFREVAWTLVLLQETRNPFFAFKVSPIIYLILVLNLIRFMST